MTKAELMSILSQGKEAWNNFRQTNPHMPIDFSRCNFNKFDLSGFNLANGNFHYSDFKDSQCIATDFSNADLSECLFKKATMECVNLSGVNLHKAVLKHCDLYHSQLNNANLTQADLFHSDLARNNLANTSLIDADLSGVNLQGAILQNADLSNANLSGAKLINTNFLNARLDGAILYGIATRDWIIDGVKCSHYYDDESQQIKVPANREFMDGEFESLMKSCPSIELRFEETLNAKDIQNIFNQQEKLNEENPNLDLRLAFIDLKGHGSKLEFYVSDVKYEQALKNHLFEQYEKTSRLEGQIEIFEKLLTGQKHEYESRFDKMLGEIKRMSEKKSEVHFHDKATIGSFGDNHGNISQDIDIGIPQNNDELTTTLKKLGLAEEDIASFNLAREKDSKQSPDSIGDYTAEWLGELAKRVTSGTVKLGFSELERIGNTIKSYFNN